MDTEPRKNLTVKYLTLILCVLSLLLAFSLLKNISYPLLWADESMTAMGGVRVMEFGYPKVHDGKNVFYDLRHSNPRLGIDEKTDAYIGGANWGQYYFAVPGIKLAEMTEDFYSKTALLRIPFALMGLTGLIVLALLGRKFFGSKSSGMGFLSLFAFFELMSVPLALHLREARYYSLTVFLAALTISVYVRYRILNESKYRTYAALLTVSLFLTFINFTPAYFIFIASIIFFESSLLAKYLISHRKVALKILPAGHSDLFGILPKKDAGPIPDNAGTGAGMTKEGEYGRMPFTPKEVFRDYVMALLPALISLIAVLPLIYFFKTFHIAEEMAKFNAVTFKTSGLQMYLDNLAIILRYFASSDFIYLAIFSKICLIASMAATPGENISVPDRRKIRFSNFLTVVFIIYVFSIARIPNFPFTRYFIALQPLLALMIILDLAVVYNLISLRRAPLRTYLKGAIIVIFAGFVFFNISKNYEHIKGHVYELGHQYRGPLDYVIPFIKQNFPEPERLVIATNYEETSFMYYLKAKVTIGFVGNNLEQDAQTVPDIVVFRKWHRVFIPVFVAFLERRNYGRISFPVADYPANNLPELNWAPPVMHLFRTWETSGDRAVDIYVRK